MTISKGDVGLGNVDNTSDADKPISTATQSALNNILNQLTRESIVTLIGEATTSLSGLMSTTDKDRLNTLYALLEENGSNDIVDTLTEVLSIFDQYPEDADILTALSGKVSSSRQVNGHSLSEDINLNKSDIGLSNVDNTSDENKPLSAASRTALASKLDASEKGVANGVATLDGNGKVLASQLPALQATKPKCVRINISGINGTTVVSAPGVSSDERTQLIVVNPPFASKSRYDAYGIQLVGVGENSLTFASSTAFVETIPVDIVIIELDPIAIPDDEDDGNVVTDENGDVITDENGNVITIEPDEENDVVTDENGNTITDENGNTITIEEE